MYRNQSSVSCGDREDITPIFHCKSIKKTGEQPKLKPIEFILTFLHVVFIIEKKVNETNEQPNFIEISFDFC